MSSFIRNLQRKIKRNHPDYEPAPQPTIIEGDGYQTLRSTKGWIRISNRRLAAQFKMAHMLDHVLAPRSKTPPREYRKPMPVPPGRETWQQRRAARRGYVPA